MSLLNLRQVVLPKSIKLSSATTVDCGMAASGQRSTKSYQSGTGPKSDTHRTSSGNLPTHRTVLVSLASEPGVRTAAQSR